MKKINIEYNEKAEEVILLFGNGYHCIIESKGHTNAEIDEFVSKCLRDCIAKGIISEI